MWKHYLELVFAFSWGFQGKNTAVGSQSFLQGIFLIQGSNLGLLLLYMCVCIYGLHIYLIYWKDRCWSWNSNTLATWWEELTPWKRPSCWERLKAGGEGDDRGWDGWMASPTWWTWFWASSRSWWWTGKPGVLQSMGQKELDRTE